MPKYYAERALEYEKIYHRPERQFDLNQIKKNVRDAFQGCDILEIACGTGYWTEYLANRGNSIHAIDCNAEVLAIAREKTYAVQRVTFQKADAYVLANIPLGFTAGFCGFWWSHVSVRRLDEFLTVFHRHLSPEARVLILDNNYVAGSSTPISRTDRDGNTYQIRQLENSSIHEVLKNFPSDPELRDYLAHYASELKITRLKYYWLAAYRVKK